ncbi:hypothetical protein F5148DRAFT_1245256 [Russula earlei]|uniref:Uncharacterized protein n=1 Tax=Russula earlei TaxID=71964 RepID=A0ACC0TVU2_9AGAM|nr:hypothetical protein F5148DRAFT_1245256 [Russula earlei]
MSSLLMNYNFLSPLKRQRAVRNRSNNATDTPSSRANRLPVLPELSGEPDVFSSSLASTSTPSLCSASSSSHTTTCPNKKRLSRYGRDEFAVGGAFAVTDDFLTSAPRAAPAAFDFVIDISASEPASLVSASEKPAPPRPVRPTTLSACSSAEMPTTPSASDDDSPGSRSSRKTITRSRIPFMILESTPSPLASEASLTSPTDTFEFTLAAFPLSDSADEDGEEEEDDGLWYSRELGQVVSLSSPCAPANSPARPDSFFSPPCSPRSSTDQSTGRSRMSKPLPSIPPTLGPNPQLDPTFLRCKSRPPRLPLRATPLPAPPSPLALHPPVVAPELQTLPASPASGVASGSAPNFRMIVIPRALPRTPIPLDVSEILDDVDAWSFATPSSTSASMLSPPRVPHSPASSLFSEEGDPVELIMSYAAQPPSPALSTTATAATESVTLPQDRDEETEANWVADHDDGKIRSRWSCSTLATVVPPRSPPQTPTSASARIRFHLGSVARRVRVRRAGGINGGEDTIVVPNNPALLARSSSESAKSSVSASATDDAVAFSGLRRKPIPLELFSL